MTTPAQPMSYDDRIAELRERWMTGDALEAARAGETALAIASELAEKLKARSLVTTWRDAGANDSERQIIEIRAKYHGGCRNEEAVMCDDAFGEALALCGALGRDGENAWSRVAVLNDKLNEFIDKLKDEQQAHAETQRELAESQALRRIKAERIVQLEIQLERERDMLKTWRKMAIDFDATLRDQAEAIDDALARYIASGVIASDQGVLFRNAAVVMRNAREDSPPPVPPVAAEEPAAMSPGFIGRGGAPGSWDGVAKDPGAEGRCPECHGSGGAMAPGGENWCPCRACNGTGRKAPGKGE